MTWCLPRRKVGSSPLARGTRHGCRSAVHNVGLIPARAGNTDPHQRTANHRRAHPRSRGEHSLVLSKSGLSAGSSPLARGTLRAARKKPVGTGLIPARAGNTNSAASRPAMSRAHPRSRGEHAVSAVVFSLIGGSSPLARGTRDGLAQFRR